MQHQCRITVLETKVFPELQAKYLRQPEVRSLSLLQARGHVSFEAHARAG